MLPRALLLCAAVFACRPNTVAAGAGFSSRPVVRVGMFYGTYPPWWEVNPAKPVNWANGRGGATTSDDFEGGLFVDIFKRVGTLGNLDEQAWAFAV